MKPCHRTRNLSPTPAGGVPLTPQKNETSGSVRTATGCSLSAILSPSPAKYAPTRPFALFAVSELYVNWTNCGPKPVIMNWLVTDVVTLPVARFTLTGPTTSVGIGPVGSCSPSRRFTTSPRASAAGPAWPSAPRTWAVHLYWPPSASTPAGTTQRGLATQPDVTTWPASGVSPVPTVNWYCTRPVTGLTASSGRVVATSTPSSGDTS